MTASIELIPIDDLHFDPANPRLPGRVDGTNETSVLDWMLTDAGLVELMGSIAENGFFPAEPLLVTPNVDGPGYIVLEGNRRLAAVKLLVRPESAPRRQISVTAVAERVTERESLLALPVVKFGKKQEVLDYLGFRHVTGVKQWEPAAKARYLQALYDEHSSDSEDEVYRVIARVIGSRADYVKKLLGALRIYERIVGDAVLAEEGLSDEDISFSLITLALNYSEIAKYLKLTGLDQQAFREVDPARVRRLGRYLFLKSEDLGRTQLGESRNMRLLAASLAHAEGRRRLRAGDIVEEAVEYTVNLEHAIALSLQQATERVERAEALIPRATVSDSILTAIEELEDLLHRTSKRARRRYGEND